MPKCLFERVSGKFIGGTSYDDITHDPVTHVQIELPAYPDRRLQRWDGAAGVRAATAGEISAYDAALRLGDEAADFNKKIVRAVLAWAADRFGITIDQARNEIIAKYRALNGS